MATKADIDFSYTLIDRVFRLSMGDAGDYSNALYDGDFSLSLEEAQRKKHEFIFESLKIGSTSRVLDMTCGWGPFLSFLQSKNVTAVGTTLSQGQAKACQKRGLDVQKMDCRTITPQAFGKFDGVVSIGGFEHFCSEKEYLAGMQETVYQNFFKTVYELLPKGGRFYLQTMVFGKNMIPYQDMSLQSDKNSDSYILALLQKQFPGSWLPYGYEQVEKTAQGSFTLLSKSNGRLDYIETIHQWALRIQKHSVKKIPFYLSLLPRYLFDKNFRLAFSSGVPANRICFQRQLLDHYRLVFERN